MTKTSKAPRDAGCDALRRLGERIRTLRHDRGFTQADLAAELELSVAYVSLIERGGRNAPYTTVVEIAGALGVQLRDLVPGDGASRRRI
jgi:transcriptional regulator with XRE-family HTH domain